MELEKFDRILGRRDFLQKQTLDRKREVYAAGKDRLGNFKQTAFLEGQSPLQSCWSKMTKHIIAVAEMVQGKVPITQERVDEFLGDIYVYVPLLEACIWEEQGFLLSEEFISEEV